MERYFWAYHQLKRREAEIKDRSDHDDFALIQVVVELVLWNHAFRGDGKFSRVKNYAQNVADEIERIRPHLNNHDDVFTAFFLGIDAAFSGILKQLELIEKKGRG